MPRLFTPMTVLHSVFLHLSYRLHSSYAALYGNVYAFHEAPMSGIRSLAASERGVIVHGNGCGMLRGNISQSRWWQINGKISYCLEGLGSKLGVISFPSASKALEIVNVAKIALMFENNVISAKSIPGHILRRHPLSEYHVQLGDFSYRRP